MVYADRYGIVGHSAAIDEVIHRLELDGYVRGAFTAATGTKKGKFAVANRSTIFLDEIGATSGKNIEAIEDGVIASLREHHWPGNVRELENTVERAVVLTTGSTMTRGAIAIDVTAGPSRGTVPSLKLQQNIEWIECATIRQALGMATGKKQAARIMGISPRALSYYLGKYPFLDQERGGRPNAGLGG